MPQSVVQGSAEPEPILAFLQAEFVRRQQKNGRLSLRAFAKQCGVDPSALRQVLGGQRRLTFKFATTILQKLDIGEAARNTLLLSLVDPSRYRKPLPLYRQVTKSELRRLIDWRCYAILCALELAEPPTTITALARHLDQPVAQIRDLVGTLRDLRLIRKEGRNLRATGEKLTTQHHDSDDFLKKAHRSYLDVAARALTERYDGSDFSGITMAIDHSRLPEAVRRIREFRRGLAAFLGEGPKDCVYRINIQLLPLSAAEELANLGLS